MGESLNKQCRVSDEVLRDVKLCVTGRKHVILTICRLDGTVIESHG